MVRDLGVNEFVQSIMSAPLTLVGSVVTLLGDAGVLLGVSLGVYWFGLPIRRDDSATGRSLDRPRGALVFALALGALSLATVLKSVFALPRPPGAMLSPAFGSGLPAALARAFVENAKSASGYGFPSGHALASTVVYGTIAFLGTRMERRWSIAAVLIALIGVSRVVLGVHYVLDVLVGCAVGLAFLAVSLRAVGFARRKRPNVRFGFALALGIALVAVIVTTVLNGDPRDGITLLGVSAGAMGAWIVLDAPEAPVSRTEGAVTVVVGIVVAGVPGLITYVLDPTLPVEFLANAGVGVAAIGTPHLTRVGARRFESVRSAIDPETQNVSR